ncbi:hypothetical protein FO519_009584 [Halicephalobus sp. NKZ332]|nr:hypothetical protein FO519_009584 [Halicephalobus sp. NKZ332]
MFIHDAIAFNRLFMVVYPRAMFLLSKRSTIVISVFVYILGFLIAWFSSYYLPCCKIYLSYGTYSPTSLDTEYNLAARFVNIPVNFTTSFIALVIYVIIYIFIRVSNKKIINMMDKSTQQTRKIQEVKLAFQFALCTICCVENWVVVLVKGKFLYSTHNSIYILAFASICGNIIYVIIYTFYFGPSCIFQDFLFPGGKNNFFPGFLTYLAHGHSIQDFLIQDITSFNRLVAVVYPKATFLSSRRATIWTIILAYILGYFTSWFADYYLPCCKFYLYYESYSYTFLDTEYNVANIFVDTPVNIVSSFVAVANYVIIYTYVHVSNRKINRVIDKSNQQTKKNQEIKYAFQFALYTAFSITTWVSFRIFSAIGISTSPVYLVLTTLQVIHSMMNSVVFLIFNKNVRKQFKYYIFGQILKC